jgi:threonine aldolase
MREVIAKAEVGDDVYGEDPSVNSLEEESARLLGKEAGLFIPSGTMGNLAALLTHCARGSEIILGDKAHTFLYEVGGMAALGGIQAHIVPNQRDGTLKIEHIQDAIRRNDIHDPPTRLITLENTHNRCGGAVLSPEYIQEVAAIARDQGLKIHLDGARIFNAAAALGVDPGVLVSPADSVMFCLSKGLGAPVGSVLCGTTDFIQRARKMRKMLGGGMRQAGLLAAAGLYALQNHRELLIEDHRRARELALGLGEVEGLSLEYPAPSSNMVYLNLDEELPMDAQQAAEILYQEDIQVGITGARQFRLVTHLWISADDVSRVIEVFRKIAA